MTRDDRTDWTDALIDAAERYAASYDDDERELIKTDVLNAFYAGANWQRVLGGPEQPK